jgi:hypothetical protein
MKERLQTLYAFVRESHEFIYRELMAHVECIDSDSMTENADHAYAMREIEKFLDDSRKDVAAQRKLAERAAAIKWSTSPSASDNIKTDYCTATPDIKTVAKIPTIEKNPDEYTALMDWLQIDPCLRDHGKVLDELGERETEIVSVKWPAFQDYVTRLVAQGYPPPPGVDPGATWKEYVLRIKKRKPIMPDSTPAFEQKGAQSTNTRPADDEIPF